MTHDITMASINGVPLNSPDETLSEDELRQRACTELLRQTAQSRDLLAADDPPAVDGIYSEAAVTAIEALLDEMLTFPDPTGEDCRRHYAAHQNTYHSGEKVHARHILFAVTPGVNVVALRKRAETALLDVRCHDDTAADEFAKAAQELSNCPSSALGGDLGWLAISDCAPEFARELFGKTEVGVLPRLVHSRFGLHVVEVLRREPGVIQPFETVQGAVAMSLRQKAYVAALRHYLRFLAEQASVKGVAFEPAENDNAS